MIFGLNCKLDKIILVLSDSYWTHVQLIMLFRTLNISGHFYILEKSFPLKGGKYVVFKTHTL